MVYALWFNTPTIYTLLVYIIYMNLLLIITIDKDTTILLLTN